MRLFPYRKRTDLYGLVDSQGEEFFLGEFRIAGRSVDDFLAAEDVIGDFHVINSKSFEKISCKESKFLGFEYANGLITAGLTGDTDEKIGFMDTQGRFAIHPRFAWASKFDLFGATVKNYPTDNFVNRIDRNGNKMGREWLSIVPYHRNSRCSGARLEWGGENMVLIDGFGEQVSNNRFQQVWRENEGLVPVAFTDEEVGWIDVNGSIVERFKANFIGNHFQNGLVPVQSPSGKWGLMDTKFNFVFDPVYDLLEGIGEGRFMVGNRDEKGDNCVQLANSQGSFLSGEFFDLIGFFEDGFAQVWRYDYLPGYEEPISRFNFIRPDGTLLRKEFS